MLLFAFAPTGLAVGLATIDSVGGRYSRGRYCPGGRFAPGRRTASACIGFPARPHTGRGRFGGLITTRTGCQISRHEHTAAVAVRSPARWPGNGSDERGRIPDCSFRVNRELCHRRSSLLC